LWWWTAVVVVAIVNTLALGLWKASCSNLPFFETSKMDDVAKWRLFIGCNHFSH
jgi:hypothetical protein